MKRTYEEAERMALRTLVAIKKEGHPHAQTDPISALCQVARDLTHVAWMQEDMHAMRSSSVVPPGGVERHPLRSAPGGACAGEGHDDDRYRCAHAYSGDPRSETAEVRKKLTVLWPPPLHRSGRARCMRLALLLVPLLVAAFYVARWAGLL